MASEKPKDLGCADVGSKYRVRNIATTEAQCRQSSVQCRQSSVQCTPIQRSMHANPAFNARPNGAKAPSPGQASAVSGTPGFARTRPIRPNGAKAATGAFKSSARKHSSCCPAPRAPPHTYNKSRAHARVYIRKTNPQKMFQPFSHHSKPAENQRKTG